jgi:hypothetical protein
MRFRFLPPSPQDERALRFLTLGIVLSSMVVGALFLFAPRGPAPAVLVGALVGLYWLYIRAAHELDRRRKRAARGSIQLLKTGLIIADFEHADRIFDWQQIKHLVIGPGKLEIHHDKGIETLATREIENSELMIGELKRRVRLGSGASDFIPLSPM